jgi:hypothetical protein
MAGDQCGPPAGKIVEDDAITTPDLTQAFGSLMHDADPAPA